jgi:ABC-2 type transport system permease protein
VHPLAWVLAPTWGMRAIRASATGGPVLVDAGVCASLGVGYALVGALLTNTLLYSARVRATLSLT